MLNAVLRPPATPELQTPRYEGTELLDPKVSATRGFLCTNFQGDLVICSHQAMSDTCRHAKCINLSVPYLYIEGQTIMKLLCVALAPSPRARHYKK